jgi:N-acetylneuraminic acid mutarotase
MTTRSTGGRLALALPLIAFVAAIVALATAGSDGSPHGSAAATSSVPAAGTTRSASAARSGRNRNAAFRASPRVVTVSLGALPAAVQDSAVAPVGSGRIALLGGIDAAQSSTAAITILTGGAAADGGALPAPQHDAQAARLGADVYVFGGGAVSSYDHILRYDPVSRLLSTAGTLPTPASDVAVAARSGTAYVVGGYDGTRPLDTILAWRPGHATRMVARLPEGLRYAAVAFAGNRLIIAGGTAGAGQTVSNAIFSFDPATGALAQIGRLPVALTHASAASLYGQVLVVGGRRTLSGDESNAILAIDPATGRVRQAGRLPAPLSDAAAAASGGRIVVAGGRSPAGTQRAIIAVVPKVR